MNNRVKKFLGKKIADRYFITGEIGAGGMGHVFKAISFNDPAVDVAIKFILASEKLGIDTMSSFQKEASLMSMLHHPNIVGFKELGIIESSDMDRRARNRLSGYYIVMEMAQGIDLKSYLKNKVWLPISVFFQVAKKLASALDYTHSKNIIHGDIKPHNMIIDFDRTRTNGLCDIKILDFGIARLSEIMSSADSQKKSAEFIGTPQYISPEQTQLLPIDADHRADLYSLGCVFYEMLVGKAPFSADTKEEILRKHAFEEPERMTRLRSDLPLKVEEIIMNLLHKDPANRYQNAFSLLYDLNEVEKVLAYPDYAYSPGKLDKFQAVSSMTKLVGRDKEFSELISTFKNVGSNHSRAQFVALEAQKGAGRSKFLNEFKTYLTGRSAQFVSVQFLEFQNLNSLSSLSKGLNDYLIRLYKSLSPLKLEIQNRLQSILGQSVSHLSEMIPSLGTFYI